MARGRNKSGLGSIAGDEKRIDGKEGISSAAEREKRREGRTRHFYAVDGKLVGHEEGCLRKASRTNGCLANEK